jgi:elongation factor 1-alpha
MHFKPMNFATAGCNVGIDLKGIQEKDCPKGTILCHIDDRPVKSVKEFTVEKAVIRTHPTVLAKGSNIIVHYQTASVCAKIKKLSNAFDISTRTMTPGEVQSVKPGTVVDIVFEPEKAIPIETKSTHPRNCKIMLRDFNCTVGWGSVSDVKISDFEI